MKYRQGDYVYVRFNRGSTHINPQDTWGEFFMIIEIDIVGAQNTVLRLQAYYRDKIHDVTIGKDIEYIQKFPFQSQDEVINSSTKEEYILVGLKMRPRLIGAIGATDFTERTFLLQSIKKKNIKVTFEQLLNEYTAK